MRTRMIESPTVCVTALAVSRDTRHSLKLIAAVYAGQPVKRQMEVPLLDHHHTLTCHKKAITELGKFQVSATSKGSMRLTILQERNRI